ncbi:MAG TPA: hypothetical protein VFZ65_21420 [Planctomycetota bacterium]|nr:hypothetical protein [Planctomycetota bacterium]
MKTLLVVLSAAIIVGLAIYGLFEACDLIGLMGGNIVMPVNAFVAFIACLCTAAGAVALALRAAVIRADRTLVRGLERRLAELERQARGS